jgi:hypothetical protein
MKQKQALGALAVLSHEPRLCVLRRLIAGGPSGLMTGAIGDALGVISHTLSCHLKELARAGLLRSWRQQRQVFYAVHIDGMRRRLTFLTEDCCHGHPEICGDLGAPAKRLCRAAKA